MTGLIVLGVCWDPMLIALVLCGNLTKRHPNQTNRGIVSLRCSVRNLEILVRTFNIMAKGIRSKRLQKKKAWKRDAIRATVLKEGFDRLGRMHYTTLNAFKNPGNPNARFP
jgi:hypothetical protein